MADVIPIHKGHISKQYQMTIVSVEQSNASSVGYIAKIVKQKLFVSCH